MKFLELYISINKRGEFSCKKEMKTIPKKERKHLFKIYGGLIGDHLLKDFESLLFGVILHCSLKIQWQISYFN
jgi:hypothetical protein